MRQQDGEVIGSDAIRFERWLPGPIERVWAYLVDPELRGRWLASGPVEPRVGGRIALTFDYDRLSPVPSSPPDRYCEMGGGFSSHGLITAIDPPRRLALIWVDQASEVTFELEPVADRVRLVLTHRRLTGGFETLVSVAAGWETHLGVLAAVAEGRDPEPYWTTHTAAEERYRATLTDRAATAGTAG